MHKNYKLSKGFTIIEILIVIVVIGILAALVFVSYSAVSRSANNSALQQDLQQITNQLEIYKVTSANGTSYPTNLADGGIDSSKGNNVRILSIGGANYPDPPDHSYYPYCLQDISGGRTYFISWRVYLDASPSSPITQTQPGYCSQGFGAVTSGDSGGTVGAVVTLAGGAYYDVDGTGVNASFVTPSGLVRDSSGNFWVVDYNQGISKLRKVTPAGVVTTPYTFSFSRAWGVAIDSGNNLYINDRSNNQIVKMTPAGIFSTFASTGLFSAFGLTTDSSNNLYVANAGNCTITKITSAGAVSVLAGSGSCGTSADGNGTAAVFNHPVDVKVDVSNNVYVTDNTAIRKITSSGSVSTINPNLGFPVGAIAVSASGNIYVTAVGSSGNDYSNHPGVYQVAQSGSVTQILGYGGDNSSSDGAFNRSYIDGSRGGIIISGNTMYIASSGSNRIFTATNYSYSF